MDACAIPVVEQMLASHSQVRLVEKAQQELEWI
jgi:hypothetical protein